jgi:phytoene desaturase
MNAAAPLSRFTGAPQPHAVVIGSGLGGLATAARLGRRGWRVTVLERLDQIGGRARMFRQDGFSFDAGPTIVTAPQVLHELWEFCGAKLSDDVTLKPMDPFYRLRFNDGSHFDASGDPERQRAEIAKFNPADIAGYERFFARSQYLYEVGFEKMGTMPYHTLGDLVRSVPDILRMEGYRSIHAFVSSYMKDERVRIAQSFHPLFIGGNPLSASAIYGLIAYLERTWGVHYAMGGTHTIVTGMARLAESFGGAIRLGADVAEITLDGGRANGVRLTSGEVIPAEIVVSNADSAWTYANLLPAAARAKWTDRKLARAKYSMGLFLWYFGTKRRYDDVPHHTIVLGPRYEGLLRDIFRAKKLTEDFSLYLHRPSASDPSVAPPGCDAFYVLSPVPNLIGGADWTTLAEDYRLRVQRRLEETVLPGLGAEVVTSKVLTPLDFKTDLMALHGAAFGLEPILLQSAYFRPHNQSEDVRNLYFTGAGTHPGAGLPGVVTSARILDQVIPHASAFA